MGCTDCTLLSPIGNDSGSCRKTKPQVDDFRIACCDDLIETIAASTASVCTNGYIDDIVSVVPLATPLVSVAIFNKEDADETNTFAFDRATDIGTDTYAFIAGIKVLNPGNQCVLESMKGQDVCLYYHMKGLSGEYQWRRLKGKLTAIDGGLLAGYQVTFDTVDPADEDKPMYINFSTAAATTAALDALTQF